MGAVQLHASFLRCPAAAGGTVLMRCVTPMQDCSGWRLCARCQWRRYRCVGACCPGTAGGSCLPRCSPSASLPTRAGGGGMAGAGGAVPGAATRGVAALPTCPLLCHLLAGHPAAVRRRCGRCLPVHTLHLPRGRRHRARPLLPRLCCCAVGDVRAPGGGRAQQSAQGPHAPLPAGV